MYKILHERGSSWPGSLWMHRNTPTQPGQTPPKELRADPTQTQLTWQINASPTNAYVLSLNLHIWEEVQVPNLGASTLIPPTHTQNVTSLIPALGMVSQRYKRKNPSFTVRQELLYWWAQPCGLLKRVSQIYFLQVSSQSQGHQGGETFCSLSVASLTIQGANPAVKYVSLEQSFKSGFFFS